ncbi:hypothetical protein CV632_01285 [Geobacillus thermodenitrificans]|uniref:HNH endonuclease n=1 Tax=Geobacillus thermodenitrificans TaxID=33940 RepID=UPI000C2858A2|nr:HNH endonuclease [Geobacillus thermodenitrificans]PJW21986.1 hypothetical protein CV632_01285 [Geobacillus thermodenitrificans]
MKVYHERGMIYFKDENINKLGYTEYDEKLWEKIISTKWHVKKGRYINSSKLGTLHRLVMAHWYGEEALAQATKMNFVVDHMNNDGFDCRLSNLCFISKDRNTAKGQTYDKKRKEAIDTIALNIFKDFKTQLFQITIAFNTRTIFKINDKLVEIVNMRLLYENDFERTLLDAEKILHEFTKYGRVDTKRLNFIEMEYTEPILLELSPDEKNSAFIERNGEVFLNLDSGQNVRFIEIPPNDDLYRNRIKES